MTLFTDVCHFHVSTLGASKAKGATTSTDTTTPGATQKKTLPNTGAKVLSPDIGFLT